MKPLRAPCLLLISVLIWTLAPAAGARSEPRTTGEAEAEAARDPEWFDKVLAREAEPLEERWLASSDGGFRSRVAAEIVSRPELIEGDYYLQLGAGTEVPVECWIYPGGHDLAATHQAVSASTFDSIAAAYGGMEAKGIARIDAGAFGPYPFVALDWIYRVQSPQGSLAGQIKHLAAIAEGGASAHCYHNETGYAETFERVVRGLIENLEVARPEPRPYHQEVTVVRLGGLSAGILHLGLTRGEEGNTRILETMSLLAPVDQQTVRASDNFNVQYSSPDGRLITEVDIESENGEIVTHLRLAGTEDGAWQVSGTLKSEEFEAALDPAAVLSTLGHMIALRDFLADAEIGAELKLLEWHSEDPAAFSEVRVEVAGRSADDFSVRLDLGTLEIDAVIDPGGSMKYGKIQVEGVPVAMELERLYVEGVLTPP